MRLINIILIEKRAGKQNTYNPMSTYQIHNLKSLNLLRDNYLCNPN